MTIVSDVTTDPQNVSSESIDGRRSFGELISWVMSRVVRWRTTRDSNYFDLWDAYFALWRGQWTTQLKIRESERSKIITPITQQCVDATVSEMVEATFGRGNWFDIRDEPNPKKKALAEQARDNLLIDMARDKIQHGVMEAFLNGAIYGTGIVKRIVDKRMLSTYTIDQYGNTQESSLPTVCIWWQAIPPYNFVIDTAALTIDDALGVAHETIRPISEIEEKQKNGEYYNVPIGSASGYATGIIARGPKGENLEVNILDGTYLTEYHGRIPAKYLDNIANADEQNHNPLSEYALQDGDKKQLPEDMVEAIVVIANGNACLKAVANPFPGGDRGFIAYQHDRVPNRFWGRGVVEKAYNAQIALDAEIRARIDAMALLTYPIVGFDATRLPRNLNLQIKPGKSFLTNGDPEEIIRPIQFGQINPAWFQHSQDLMQMVQLATGTFDQDGPAYGQGGTASGASMSMGAAIKRAKLTMQTIDEDFLDPLVKKTYLAYQTLDPERYPHLIDFEVNSSMSIMAREFEQTQMTNLLAIIPPQTPAFFVVLKAIVENYSGPSRTQLIQAIDQMMQPNPQQQQLQQMTQQLQVRGAAAEVKKLEAEVAKLQSELPVNQAKAADLQAKAQNAPAQTQLQMMEMMLKAKQEGNNQKHQHLDRLHAHVQHHKDHVHDVLDLASRHTLAQDQMTQDARLAREKNQADVHKAKYQAQASIAQAKMANQTKIKEGTAQRQHESKEAQRDRLHEHSVGMLSRRHESKESQADRDQETQLAQMQAQSEGNQE
jgi:virulence-associated protein VagC